MMMLSASGCARNTPASSSFCLTYEPVYTHADDTEGTKRQVDGNNAAYEELCVK